MGMLYSNVGRCCATMHKLHPVLKSKCFTANVFHLWIKAMGLTTWYYIYIYIYIYISQPGLISRPKLCTQHNIRPKVKVGHLKESWRSGHLGSQHCLVVSQYKPHYITCYMACSCAILDRLWVVSPDTIDLSLQWKAASICVPYVT